MFELRSYEVLIHCMSSSPQQLLSFSPLSPLFENLSNLFCYSTWFCLFGITTPSTFNTRTHRLSQIVYDNVYFVRPSACMSAVVMLPLYSTLLYLCTIPVTSNLSSTSAVRNLSCCFYALFYEDLAFLVVFLGFAKCFVISF